MNVLAILLVLVMGQSSFAISCFRVAVEPARTKRTLIQKLNVFEKYHETFTNHQLTEAEIPVHLENIKKMAAQILKDNFQSFSLTEDNASLPLDYKGYSVTKTNYHIFSFQNDSVYFQIRSNGFVSFLHMSWQQRDLTKVKHHKMAYVFNEKIVSGHQTEFLLSTFPEKFVLSRDMGRKERARWLNREAFYQGGYFKTKVHFAPNYFRFKDYQPYQIHITKEQLIDFYLGGFLEINSYDYISERQRLVPNQMNMESEVVFTGDEALAALAPLMQNELKQDILGF